MSKQRERLYEFGPFRLDVTRPRLMRDGEIIPLTPKALEVLVALVQSNGAVVEKEDLIQKVWPDTFVEDSNLSVHIFSLRKALGRAPGAENFIETIPRVGFRFNAPVRTIEPNNEELVVEKHTYSQITIEQTEESTADESVAPYEQRTLAPATFERPQSRRLFIGIAILTVLIAVSVATFLWLRTRPQREHLPPPVQTIAVLPFKRISGNSDDEYLRIGVADALITKLANLKQIVVRPSSATLRYVDSKQDVTSIGRDLGVEAVLDGHLQRDGDRIRATVQLVRVSDGSHIWAGRFDDSFTNIFTVQDSISDQVARALLLKLTEADQKVLSKQYTQNTEAYHAYLIGRHFLNKRTDDGVKQALYYFKQAIDKDPLYAMAYAGMAEAYTLSSYYSAVPPRDTFPKARAAAERSLEIDNSLVEALTTLAYVKFIYEWDFDSAERDFQRTFELNPNYANARFWYGECLMYLGRFVEGIAQIKRAQELDPLSLVYSANLGWAYHIARQDDIAIPHLQKIIQSDSSYHMAFFYLGMAYESKGMFAEAISAYQKSAELSGGYPGKYGLAHVYGVSGRRDEALKILADLDAEARQQKPVRATSYALIYAGMNDLDKTFEWLEKAYEQRYEGVVYLKVQPYYDNLRSDPRYFNLLKRIGLSS